MMKPLLVIVGHVCRDDVSEMALTEEDEVPEAFVLDGFDEALRREFLDTTGTDHHDQHE